LVVFHGCESEEGVGLWFVNRACKAKEAQRLYALRECLVDIFVKIPHDNYFVASMLPFGEEKN
jgi:hypothetical protein